MTDDTHDDPLKLEDICNLLLIRTTTLLRIETGAHNSNEKAHDSRSRCYSRPSVTCSMRSILHHKHNMVKAISTVHDW